MSDGPPVIILTFANDQGAFLEAITTERKLISGLLRPYAVDGSVQVWAEPEASIEDVFGLFNAYDGRIAIFHYGGHANGEALLLEGDGDNEIAHGAGLAQLFAQQKDTLQLVFLNGCATKGQVETLLKSGVKAVIATSVKIVDDVATRFARQFYDGLVQGQSIGRAFETAQAFVVGARGEENRPKEYRDLDWETEAQGQDTDMPWGLYLGPLGDSAKGWTLPGSERKPVAKPDLSGAGEAADWANVALRSKLIATLKTVNPDFAAKLQFLESMTPPDPRLVRQAVVDAFPRPIGEQVRKLFSSNKVNDWRLRQLVLTYEITIKLFCFSVLAQMWDARIAGAELKVADQHLLALDAFLTLRRETAEEFDYHRLIVAVLRIFEDNKVAPFMSECAGLAAELTDDPTRQAHDFMEGMRKGLRGEVKPELLADLCQQGETHLATILADLAFITRYKATTIKSIEFTKFRTGKPMYIHTEFALDRASDALQVGKRHLDASTDSGSVLLQKSRETASDFVNLTPFVVDENAIGAVNQSNLFFLSYHDVEDDTYHYSNVVDPSVELVARGVKKVDPEGYPIEHDDRTLALDAIKSMFDDFKDMVLRFKDTAPRP